MGRNNRKSQHVVIKLEMTGDWRDVNSELRNQLRIQLQKQEKRIGGAGGGKKRTRRRGRRVAGQPATRIYVGGINNSVTREHLENLFSKYGKTKHIWVSPRGDFAFVNFETEQAAPNAVGALNGEDFMGCKLRVEVSRPKASGSGQGGGRGPRFGWDVASGGAVGANSVPLGVGGYHGLSYNIVDHILPVQMTPPGTENEYGPYLNSNLV